MMKRSFTVYVSMEKPKYTNLWRKKMSDEKWNIVEQMIGITMLLLIIFAVLLLISLIIQLTLSYVM